MLFSKYKSCYLSVNEYNGAKRNRLLYLKIIYIGVRKIYIFAQKFEAIFYHQSWLQHLTTIADPWYFWKGICLSKAHKPVTLSGNATFTKVFWHIGEGFKAKKNSASNLKKKNWGRFSFDLDFRSFEIKKIYSHLKNVN